MRSGWAAWRRLLTLGEILHAALWVHWSMNALLLLASLCPQPLTKSSTQNVHDRCFRKVGRGREEWRRDWWHLHIPWISEIISSVRTISSKGKKVFVAVLEVPGTLWLHRSFQDTANVWRVAFSHVSILKVGLPPTSFFTVKLGLSWGKGSSSCNLKTQTGLLFVFVWLLN